MAKSGPSSNKKRTGRIRYEGRSDTKKFLLIAENYHQSTSRTVFLVFTLVAEICKKNELRNCSFSFKAHIHPVDFSVYCWVHYFDWVCFSLGFSHTPPCCADTSTAFTHMLIKGDFMIFRRYENQRSAHCFLGEHRPFSSRFSLYLYLALFSFSLPKGAAQLHWPSIKWVAK